LVGLGVVGDADARVRGRFGDRVGRWSGVCAF
jgi:hypothetical protein